MPQTRTPGSLEERTRAGGVRGWENRGKGGGRGKIR